MNDFDELARQWDMNPMHLERTQSVATEMLNRIPVTGTMTALEFGAGTGLLSFFLKDRFARVTLMDTSAEMLRMAEAKLAGEDRQKILTSLFDLEHNAWTDEPFDIIFTQMVMHHIRNVEAMLDQFGRMIRPGGYLAIADLYEEDGSFHDGSADVHHGFDPLKLGDRLKEIGFSEVKTGPCFIVRRDITAGNVKEYPVFLLTARKP